MTTLADGAATTDPAHTLVDAVRTALADLDGHPLCEMTEDVELAELVGRLKSLTGVLVSVIDR